MTNRQHESDVILIGAGVMSSTLGVLLKQVAPEWTMTVFEKLAVAGEESSNEWNNAGTGHAALCELNYTVDKPDGTVDISKAIKINEHFQVSLQFWSYLVKQKLIDSPQEFIKALPHMSMVQGQANIDFLERRFKALTDNPLFKGMEFSEDPETLMDWMPLMMQDRPAEDKLAATKIDTGTDVNFGALTHKMFDYLVDQGVQIHYQHSVTDIKRANDGKWEVKVRNLESGTTVSHKANFVFIGGGGGSLHMLQKSGIPEGKHIGGFPVSGIFMACNNPAVVEQHHAKVYGKAKVGAPPMSVPHLDTRFINNQKMLLFGPFAGFSPKFLKHGSVLDLFTSVKADNLITMLAAGAKNMSLTKYLIQQVMLSKEQRMQDLREFIPNAKSEDWDLVIAGQRVQVIRDTDAGKGTLQFGTEVISSQDGSIAALLGASPGASTAVQVMLEVMERCFPENIGQWEAKIKEMVPSYGQSLMNNQELLDYVHTSTAKTLELVDENSKSELLKQA